MTEGKVIPDRSLVLGTPGRVVRPISDAEALVLEASAAHYVQNGKRYLHASSLRLKEVQISSRVAHPKTSRSRT